MFNHNGGRGTYYVILVVIIFLSIFLVWATIYSNFLTGVVVMDAIHIIASILAIYFFTPPKSIEEKDMFIEQKYLRFNEPFKYYQRYERVFDPDPYNDILQMEPKDYTETYVVPNTNIVCRITNLDYEKALYKKFAFHNTNIGEICEQVKEQMLRQGFRPVIQIFDIKSHPRNNNSYNMLTGYSVFFSNSRDEEREDPLIAERKKFFKQVLYNIDMNDAEAIDISLKMLNLRNINGILSEYQSRRCASKKRNRLYEFTKFKDKKKWLDLCIECEREEVTPYIDFKYLSRMYKRIENVENDRLKYLKFVYENLPTTQEAYDEELNMLKNEWNKMYCPTSKIVESKQYGTCMTLIAYASILILTQSGHIHSVLKSDVKETTRYGDYWR